MKNTHWLLSITVVSFFSLSALADWSRPVSYMEVSFGCKGLAQDPSGRSAINLVAGEGTEFRPVEGVITFQAASNGAQALLQGKAFGQIAELPGCEVKDTGDDPVAPWNAVTLNSEANLTLSYHVEFASCQMDKVNGGFTRTDIYTLSIKDSTAYAVDVPYYSQLNYRSLNDCQSDKTNN